MQKLLHARVLAVFDLVRRSDGDDAAFIEHRDAVGIVAKPPLRVYPVKSGWSQRFSCSPMQ